MKHKPKIIFYDEHGDPCFKLSGWEMFMLFGIVGVCLAVDTILVLILICKL